MGGYSNIRRLARRLAFDFDPATLSYNPDFNSESLRGNVVFRWEYIRGSTFYAVWNMSKSDASRPGLFQSVPRSRLRLRWRRPSVFMVKMSYWMAR